MSSEKNIDVIWDHKDFCPLPELKNGFNHVTISKYDFSKLENFQKSNNILQIYNHIQKIVEESARTTHNSLYSESIPFSPQIINELSDLFLDSEFKRFKCVFYTPPLCFQDEIQQVFTLDQFLTFSWYWLNWLNPLIDETGFLITHAIESTYSKLRILLDKILGRQNHIATIIWKKANLSKLQVPPSFSNGDYLKNEFDYILIYSKNIDRMKFYKLPPDISTYQNLDNDPRGPWHSMPLVASQKSSNKRFSYTFKNGITITKKFRYPYHSIKHLEETNCLHYTNPKGRPGIPRVKKFYHERLKTYQKTGKRGFTPNSLWIEGNRYGALNDYWPNRFGSLYRGNCQKRLFIPYRVPKLYENLLEITTREHDIIFDSFLQYRVLKDVSRKLNRHYFGIEWYPTLYQDNILDDGKHYE